MSTTHPATTAKIRKHDRDAATDTSWITGLRVGQAIPELEAELARVEAIDDLHSDYAEAVKALRIAALKDRLDILQVFARFGGEHALMEIVP